VLYPSSDYEQMEYHGDGSLKRKAIWDNQSQKDWIEYAYDGFGRLIETTYPDEGTVAYEYDGFGRRLRVDDGRNATDNIGGSGAYEGLIDYAYDPLGRTTCVTEQDGYQIWYAYRADGQKETIEVVQASDPNTALYLVGYDYDEAGRLKYVMDPPESISGFVAEFAYDDNGNRSQLTYYLSGSMAGSTVDLNYTYNRENQLVAFETTNGPTFDFDASSAGDIDGLGRLVSGDETIGATSHALDYSYDRLGQMTAASVTNINSATWTGSYTYHDDGNLDSRTEGGSTQDHSYTGDLLTGIDANNLAWDDNGNMTTGIGVSVTRNADGRVQSATSGNNSIDCVYDPDGRMVRKVTTIGASASTEKFILDIVGDYPVVLMVKDPNTPANNKTYVHANGEVLTERVFIYKYFYLHDRLGSVRQLVNTSGNVVNSYTYDPWGNAFPSETSETVDNDIEFANYQWDDTVGMYYLNARWYDPVILRFTGRDPVRGSFREPLGLHTYLYCANDPINYVDPDGEFFTLIGLVFAKAMAGTIRESHNAYAWWTAAALLEGVCVLTDIYLVWPVAKEIAGNVAGKTSQPKPPSGSDEYVDELEWLMESKDAEKFLDKAGGKEEP